MVEDCISISNCRLCGNPFFENKLKLKPTPLANELFVDRKKAMSAETFPLNLVMCISCNHIQLESSVSSERLFKNYLYTSSTSKIFQRHFDQYAQYVKEMLTPGSKILEIGSNDGYLLSKLAELGFDVTGLEPSATLSQITSHQGLRVINDYLGTSFVNQLLDSGEKYDCIIGNNVFAHIPNLAKAFSDVSIILKDQGLFIMEVAHAAKIVTDGIFDSIYHEHHSYHTLIALRPFLESLKFGIVKASIVETHGGSLRLVLRKNSVSSSSEYDEIEKNERLLGLDNPKVFLKIQTTIDEVKRRFDSAIYSEDNQAVIGYSAPAKAITLLSQVCDDPSIIQFIVDDNVLKQGKFIPKFGIPIVEASHLTLFRNNSSKKGVLCLIFAWNITSEIENKLSQIMPLNSKFMSLLPVRGG